MRRRDVHSQHGLSHLSREAILSCIVDCIHLEAKSLPQSSQTVSTNTYGRGGPPESEQRDVAQISVGIPRPTNGSDTINIAEGLMLDDTFKRSHCELQKLQMICRRCHLLVENSSVFWPLLDVRRVSPRRLELAIRRSKDAGLSVLLDNGRGMGDCDHLHIAMKEQHRWQKLRYVDST